MLALNCHLIWFSKIMPNFCRPNAMSIKELQQFSWSKWFDWQIKLTLYLRVRNSTTLLTHYCIAELPNWASVRPSYDRKKFVTIHLSTQLCWDRTSPVPITSNIDKRQVWQFVVLDDDFKRFSLYRDVGRHDTIGPLILGPKYPTVLRLKSNCFYQGISMRGKCGKV